MSSPNASSLDKALALLFAFVDSDRDQQVYTVSALAEAQGMDKAQVSRALATFAKYGLVERLEPRRGYQLGWSIVHLASRALHAQTMSSIYPALSQLATDWDETVHFSIRDGADSVALAAFEPDRRLYVNVQTGRRDALIGSAVGYALLSRSTPEELRSIFDSSARRARSEAGSWTAVREDVQRAAAEGHSVVVNERDELVTTVAVPVIDVGNYRDRVYAAIGVSAPDDRVRARHAELVERLVEIADSANAFLRGKEAGAG
ncbi:MAG: IclR family transcriptional regulator [Mycobacterium sp.]